MKFSLKLINQYLKPKLTFATVKKLLDNHLFESELITKTKDDYILNIEILPNRAFDLLSHYGLARELASLANIKTNQTVKFIEYKPKALIQTTKPFIKFIDESSNNLLRYSYLYIKNIKVIDSPPQIKNLLFSLGVKPINLLVDLTNLIMIELGQPLHAFDADAIENNTIIVGFPKQIEKLETFDGQIYDLDTSILTIRDPVKPLAIAGVKGGIKSGINHSTKNVVIESANFSVAAIRHTASSLKIGSDAEKRFKNGLDPKLTVLALTRFLELYFKYAPRGNYEFYDFKNPSLIYPKPKSINLSLANINSLLNTRLTVNHIRKTLNRLCFKIIKANKENLTVKPPYFRNDLHNERDIIDEIFRLMDLQNIKRVTYFSEVKKPIDLSKFKIIKNIRKFLIDNGFSEVTSYSSVSKNRLLDFYKENQFESFFKIKNPISLEFEYLRPTLYISLLQAVLKNIRFFDEFNLFEIGKIYSYDQSLRRHPYEENRLGLALYHKTSDNLQLIKMIRVLKGLIDAICSQWGKVQFVYRASDELDIYLRNVWCGKIMLLSSTINKKYKILGKTLMAELFLDKIIMLEVKKQKLYPFNKFPTVKRDLSIIPAHFRYEEIIKMIEDLNLNYLQDLQLFDVYIDKNKGFTSYTLHLYFGLNNRNVTEREVDADFKKIINVLQNKGIIIR